MKDVQTKKIEKHLFSAYLRKAESFRRGVKHAEAEGDWNLACSNAVHCAISCADALTTFYLGERSKGERHEDAVEVLRRTGIPGIEERMKQFLDILSLKSLSEYEPSEPGEEMARRTIKQAERFHDWTKQVLKQ